VGRGAMGLSRVAAWAGGRWDFPELPRGPGGDGDLPELPRLIHPAMALGAYRLVAQDLRQDGTTALFLSLLVYGTALMAPPRVKRAAGRTAAAA
jgi:hypothetical protein